MEIRHDEFMQGRIHGFAIPKDHMVCFGKRSPSTVNNKWCDDMVVVGFGCVQVDNHRLVRAGVGAGLRKQPCS